MQGVKEQNQLLTNSNPWGPYLTDHSNPNPKGNYSELAGKLSVRGLEMTEVRLRLYLSTRKTWRGRKEILRQREKMVRQPEKKPTSTTGHSKLKMGIHAAEDTARPSSSCPVQAGQTPGSGYLYGGPSGYH